MKRKYGAILLLVFLLVCGVRTCPAQGGPPLITDDPDTPGNKHWEINTGFMITALDHETDYQLPFLDFNYGAGDHVQLKFQVPYNLLSAGQDTDAGWGNSQAGVKWRCLDEDKNGVSVSTYPQFTFGGSTSSVRSNLAQDGWQLLLPIEMSKTFGKFQFDGEAGYNLQQRFPNEIWLGVIGAMQASERVQLLFELHTMEAQHFTQHDPVFDIGTRTRLTKLTTLLFTAGRSLPGTSGPEQRFFMFAGVQFTF